MTLILLFIITFVIFVGIEVLGLGVVVPIAQPVARVGAGGCELRLSGAPVHDPA